MLDQNPYAVTTVDPSLENARFAVLPHSRRAWWCLALVGTALPLLVIGTVLAFWDIESIVGSGPVMLVYGGVLLYLTTGKGLPRFRWFAWVAVGFPIAIFFLIFLLSWAPKDAQEPVSWTISVMTGVCWLGVLLSLWNHQQNKRENEILFSLRERADALPDHPATSLGVDAAINREPDNPFLVQGD